MVAEVFAGVTALKTAFDTARAIKGIDDAVKRNEAVIELQQQILSAQSEQAQLIDTVQELRRRLSKLEDWQAEKGRYELVEIGSGKFVYKLKQNEQAKEPSHMLCANCFADEKKSFLQQYISGSDLDGWRCSRCKDEILIHKGRGWHAAPAVADDSGW